MQEIYLFIKRFLSSPTEIGALFPSSKKMGRRMAGQSLPDGSAPMRYLEVGAGSGAITRPLVGNLREMDWLDVVETDSKFCKALKSQFSHLPNVAIHEASILDFCGKDYDIVISSLPLNAFKAHRVEEILKKYEKLVKQDGHLSYYEYLGIKNIKQTLSFGKRKSDFQDVQQLKRSFSDKYKTEIDTIWWNMPPARIIHCKMGFSKSSSS